MDSSPLGGDSRFLLALCEQLRSFRARVLDDSGAIRTYVNVYIGDDDARAKGGTGAAVPDGSEVMVIPAMAGGSA